MPQLQCEVYDNILSGLSNSLLGVFSIDLKRIISRTQIQVQEDIDEANKNVGMGIARNLLLGQLGLGVKNNINNINNVGMQEKDLSDSNNNIISTDSKNQSLLNISKTINKKESFNDDDENEKFLEEDENKLNDSNNGEVNISNSKINNMVFTIAQKGQRF